MMRITIDLPDEVYQEACALAVAQDISLGDAVAELVRKALLPGLRIQEDGPFPCFSIPEGAPPSTLEQTQEAEDQL